MAEDDVKGSKKISPIIDPLTGQPFDLDKRKFIKTVGTAALLLSAEQVLAAAPFGFMRKRPVAGGGGPPPPTPTLVQSQSLGYTSATAHTINFSANATVGNVIMMLTAGRASTDIVSACTGLGATFTKIASIFVTNANYEIWKGVCGTAGTQVSVTSSVGLIRTIQIQEWSNLTGTLDSASTGTNTISFTNNTNAVNTTNAPCVVFAGGTLDKTGTAGAGPSNSFVDSGVINQGTNPTLMTGFQCYYIASATGSYSTTWTLSGTGSPNSCMVSAAVY